MTLSTSHLSPRTLHWPWFALWLFLAIFAGFEVAKHGFVNWTPLYAFILTATAIGFFIAPDLTFIIGANDNVEKGSISTRAVPYYNTAHRILIQRNNRHPTPQRPHRTDRRTR